METWCTYYSPNLTKRISEVKLELGMYPTNGRFFHDLDHYSIPGVSPGSDLRNALAHVRRAISFNSDNDTTAGVDTMDSTLAIQKRLGF